MREGYVGDPAAQPPEDIGDDGAAAWLGASGSPAAVGDVDASGGFPCRVPAVAGQHVVEEAELEEGEVEESWGNLKRQRVGDAPT